MKKTYSAESKLKILLVIGFILTTLIACEKRSLQLTGTEIGSAPRGQPLHITSIKISPEPIVGKIAIMEVEVMSTNDEADVKFTIDTLEDVGNKIHLVSGDTTGKAHLLPINLKYFR